MTFDTTLIVCTEFTSEQNDDLKQKAPAYLQSTGLKTANCLKRSWMTTKNVCTAITTKSRWEKFDKSLQYNKVTEQELVGIF